MSCLGGEHRVEGRAIQMPADVVRHEEKLVVMWLGGAPCRTRTVGFLVALMFEAFSHAQVFEESARRRRQSFTNSITLIARGFDQRYGEGWRVIKE